MSENESMTDSEGEAEDFADSWRPEDKAIESAEKEFRAAHPHALEKESSEPAPKRIDP